MFLIELVTAGLQGKPGFMQGAHLEGFALWLGFSFSILCLLTCSGVVVADRKATKGTGGWERARGGAGRGQGGQGQQCPCPVSLSLLHVPVPAQCPCPCPAQLGQFQVSRCALAAPFSLQARLFSSTRICHRGFVGYLELRESWA